MDQNWRQIQTSWKQTIFGNQRKSMKNQQNGCLILWLTWQNYETCYQLLTCTSFGPLQSGRHLLMMSLTVRMWCIKSECAFKKNLIRLCKAFKAQSEKLSGHLTEVTITGYLTFQLSREDFKSATILYLPIWFLQ